jgi:hypothetical protein
MTPVRTEMGLAIKRFMRIAIASAATSARTAMAAESQRRRRDLCTRGKGGGEALDVVVAQDVERGQRIEALAEPVEEVLPERQSELHGADLLARVQHRHHAPHAEPGDAPLQAGNRVAGRLPWRRAAGERARGG